MDLHNGRHCAVGSFQLSLDRIQWLYNLNTEMNLGSLNMSSDY